PKRHAAPVTEGWGRTPVLARVDGQSWETSVWRDQKYGTLLPVPKWVRGGKGDGDSVEVELLPPVPRVAGARRRRPADQRGGASSVRGQGSITKTCTYGVGWFIGPELRVNVPW